MRRILTATLSAAAVLLALLVLPAPGASAHVERPSYWPDPKADCQVSPCAGGKIPKTRSLASALVNKKPGETRVVCRKDSMRRVKRAVRVARVKGYDIRPTVHKKFGPAQAKRLLQVNRKLFKRCDYRQIQPAVTDSSNNDRVVVMPGLYRETRSRRQPTGDKSCAKYRTESDSGDPGALSHDFQLNCPNDANLIAVIGRGPDNGTAPSPPREERHGIPALGKCIRCNFQLEGSGVSADDVIIEAGNAKAGNGGPSAVGHKKDVGVFVDRADGFVLRNVTVRHAREHDIYVLETDGYRLERFKVYYAGGYGVLTFTGDHGLIQDCDAAGHGDSGLYPGSGADSTDNRYKKFYPKFRYSQTVRRCDSHHNASGFSGTNSHGTLVTRNNFYDNALGFTTDVFTAPGHPGFPQHGNTVSRNNFYSNNFNPFAKSSDVKPFIAAPVGTGLWLAGGNNNLVRNNRFYDNWRRGTMLFAVPDATVCGPPPVGSETPVPGCEPAGVSTSFGNRFYGNTMGVSPAGKKLPNGTDFWWDSFPGNTGNCWWGNKAASGARITSAPPRLPDCAGGTRPAMSVGTGDLINEGELVACLAGFEVSGYPAGNPYSCTWSKTPAKPSGSSTPLLRAKADPEQGAQLASVCAAGLSPRLCEAVTTLRPPMALRDLFRPSLVDKNLPAATLPARVSTQPLGTITCSWWRRADRSDRLAMVQRIRDYATAPINGRGGDDAYGYGAGLSDTRAMRLLQGRCSTFEAGPFALYKIYGAAAPFSGYVG
ncbi:right-handed parallel beta-helix repeat-containing protein [Nocardioides salsibiostraticola]